LRADFVLGFLRGMAQFRLLQITDLHISLPPDDIGELSLWMSMQSLYPSRAREPVLSAAAEFVINRQSDIDVVIFSGDLADDGLIRNLDAAMDFLEEPAFRPGAAYTDEGYPTVSELDPGRTLFVLPGVNRRSNLTPYRRPILTPLSGGF